jgi:hypothetical protein
MSAGRYLVDPNIIPRLNQEHDPAMLAEPTMEEMFRLLKDPIASARKALIMGERELISAFPIAIKKIIVGRLWESEKKGPHHDGAPFTSFREWVEYVGVSGLGITYEQLMHYCELHKDCYALLLGEIGQAARHGANQHKVGVDVIKSSPTQGGTSQTYIISRLKRDNPTLAEQVIQGFLSPHRAAIEAGFKKPTWTAPCEPDALVRAIRNKFGEEFLRQMFFAAEEV